MAKGADCSYYYAQEVALGKYQKVDEEDGLRGEVGITASLAFRVEERR